MSVVLTDLDGRLIILRNHLVMLSEAAQAHANAYSSAGPISEDAMWGWARALENLASETQSLHEEYVRQSDAAGAR